MLTRLKVNGFKNLVDVDVRFGPFTCIAGVNGSGKSNLFDAIRFLAALAEKPLVEAALSIVRGSGGRSADIRSLFHRVGDQYADEMSFEIEMIIPAEGIDDLGQPIMATATLLSYSLDLAYRGEDRHYPSMPVRIVREELYSITTQIAPQEIRFPYASTWFDAVVRHARPSPTTFISIEGETAGRLRWIQEDQENSGSRTVFVASPLVRTYLSSTSEARPPEARSPTVALAQQEMRSWRVLQLDPTVIRVPDDVTAPTTVGSRGEHVAATLYSIAHAPPPDGRDPIEYEAAIYSRVAGRVYDLIGEVVEVDVERDEKREEFTLYVTDRNGTRHSARVLSDGTLRFLALAVILEEQRPGLLCIEEPENGIHPGRIDRLIELLQDIAVDTSFPIEEGNPLRQVIVSTHSPSVVMRVPGDSLVVAELWPSHDQRGRFKRARFRGLASTWRDPEPGRDGLALGTLLTYLNPEGYRPLPAPDPELSAEAEPKVIDRADVRRMFGPIPPD